MKATIKRIFSEVKKNFTSGASLLYMTPSCMIPPIVKNQEKED